MKKGFHPLKNSSEKTINYVKYYLVPGIWISSENVKPIPCWGAFTPEKKCLGCSPKFLDAKEKVKSHKISKFLKK